jgi:hypothetical protein
VGWSTRNRLLFAQAHQRSHGLAQLPEKPGVSGVAATRPWVGLDHYAPNRHDTESTMARSVDEVAPIRDTISRYAPLLIASLSIPNSSHRRAEKIRARRARLAGRRYRGTRGSHGGTRRCYSKRRPSRRVEYRPLAGSGLSFQDEGLRALKGIDEPFRLFSLSAG